MMADLPSQHVNTTNCLILGKSLCCTVSSPSPQHRLVITEVRKPEENLSYHKEIHDEFSK